MRWRRFCCKFHLAVRQTVHHVTSLCFYSRQLTSKWWWRHDMETPYTWLALCEKNSPVIVGSFHKGQECKALIFPFLLVWINCWTNSRVARELRHHDAHAMPLQFTNHIHIIASVVWKITICHFLSPLSLLMMSKPNNKHLQRTAQLHINNNVNNKILIYHILLTFFS